VQGRTGRERGLFSKWTITSDDAEHRIARALRICVGNELRKMYGDVRDEPLPPKIADLLRRLG
jgi:Anti-sigma factor NepR